MRTIDAQEIQGGPQAIFELVKNGEAVKVKISSDNVIVMSEGEYNDMAKALRNAEYLAMLEHSIQQARDGKLVFKTLEELKALARQ